LNKNLSAIEIAEGALMADIAVILHLISVYLPVGGIFFRLLIPVVFAVLVLRRNFYLGILSLGVTFFLSSVMTGLIASTALFLEGGAGLYLGVAMKHRMRHLPLLLLGVTGGAIALYISFVSLTLLLGLSPDDTFLSFHRVYETLISGVGMVVSSVGFGGWWKQTAYPCLTSMAQFAFSYMWVLLFVAFWIPIWPHAIVVYFITNVFVRLLGYSVRPIPGGRLYENINRVTKNLVRESLKRKMKRRQNAKG
jgi:hypothetical protein